MYTYLPSVHKGGSEGTPERSGKMHGSSIQAEYLIGEVAEQMPYSVLRTQQTVTPGVTRLTRVTFIQGADPTTHPTFEQRCYIQSRCEPGRNLPNDCNHKYRLGWIHEPDVATA